MKSSTHPHPLVQDLVLVGGGHTHALVLKAWGMKPLPGVRLTVINPAPMAPYTGMLPGFVAGHYGRDELDIDLVRLTRFADGRLVLGTATHIDRAHKIITVPGRPPLAYDIASIDIGITSDMPRLEGFSDHGVAAKPLGLFAEYWQSLRSGAAPGPIAVLGAGIAGVELALAMHHDLDSRGWNPRITLIEADRALADVTDQVRARLLHHLQTRGVTVCESARPTRVTSSHVHLEDGRTIPADHVIGAAGARPWPWLSDLGLRHEKGFLEVDETLRTSDPAIFATGDCAHLAFAPRPKAGVFAVRAAPTLTHNLKVALSRGAYRRFHPQKDYLKLVSLGEKRALGEKWGMAVEGPRIWGLKDRIDRAFMGKLSDLRPPPQPVPPFPAARGLAAALGDKPMCGGCGSKVGPGSLASALLRLPRQGRDDITIPSGDDAALVAIGGARQALSTDHLRAFTEDLAPMARISALHALADIWAMGAAPQVALANVILPPMNETLQARTLDEILAVAAQTFTEAGAILSGGHTTLGQELTLGFTVTGLLAGDPITLAGAKPGDALILTRPIGSGTLLSAEMQMAAKGGDVAALLAELQRPQGPAAAILSRAHAMTDVTGFGLAGHLMNICNASDAAAVIDLASVPVFPGALDLAVRGHRSTIYPQNLESAGAAITDLDLDDPRVVLLFDPQTAGGMLAAIAPETAEPCLQQLLDAGFGARCIGHVTPGPPGLTLS